MLTVLEALKLSEDYLSKKGIESARTNAELLLAEILKCKRLDLYLSFDRPLTDDEKNAYREFIARRGKFEPLQYIIGYVEFYGIKLWVDENVLIPRQETEILIDTVLDFYGKTENLKILDIGTGSGNIAVALASKLKTPQIIGIDISEQSLTIAEKNIETHGFGKLIKLQKLDILNGYDSFKDIDFDIIVSNPPYVSANDLNDLQPEIKNFEPVIAVTDSADGFSFYEHIAKIAPSLLSKNGMLFFEAGVSQADRIAKFMNQYGFDNIGKRKDYLDIDRVVYGRTK